MTLFCLFVAVQVVTSTLRLPCKVEMNIHRPMLWWMRTKHGRRQHFGRIQKSGDAGTHHQFPFWKKKHCICHVKTFQQSRNPEVQTDIWGLWNVGNCADGDEKRFLIHWTYLRLSLIYSIYCVYWGDEYPWTTMNISYFGVKRKFWKAKKAEATHSHVGPVGGQSHSAHMLFATCLIAGG